MTIWFLLCDYLGDGKRRRCSLRWGAERGWGTPVQAISVNSQESPCFTSPSTCDFLRLREIWRKTGREAGARQGPL